MFWKDCVHPLSRVQRLIELKLIKAVLADCAGPGPLQDPLCCFFPLICHLYLATVASQ